MFVGNVSSGSWSLLCHIDPAAKKCFYWQSTEAQEASLIAQLVKNLPAVQETLVQFLSPEDVLEKGKATHYSILALPLWLSW